MSDGVGAAKERGQHVPKEFDLMTSPEELRRGEVACTVGVFCLFTKRSIFSCGTGRFLSLNWVSLPSLSCRLFCILMMAFISSVLTFFSKFQRLNWSLYCFLLYLMSMILPPS